MVLKLSNLKPKKGSKSSRKRVGRGNGSGYGTYAGRGMNGQRSRSGGKGGLKLKGFRSVLKRIPKKKGFKSIHQKPAIINIETLQNKFKSGDKVNLKVLQEKNILSKKDKKFKILGRGKLNKKLTVYANQFSKPALKIIEKAGGKAITR
ncbi:MAG TPA: 50S ribosomal protein L15 [Patescibacteria group bacterium]|nr:50S ribosomal protein L15 [Patescibacteria group bacterium]